MKKKHKNNAYLNIFILTVFFIIATVFVIINAVEESSPNGQFVAIEENQTVETSKQAAINIGVIVISAIIMVGIGMHFLLKFIENTVKRL